MADPGANVRKRLQKTNSERSETVEESSRLGRGMFDRSWKAGCYCRRVRESVVGEGFERANDVERRRKELHRRLSSNA